MSKPRQKIKKRQKKKKEKRKDREKADGLYWVALNDILINKHKKGGKHD